MYPEGSPDRNVTSLVVNFDYMANVPNPLLFELNLTNISSLGVFNLQSVASYQPVTIPNLGVTLGPATDMSDTIQLIIGRHVRRLSNFNFHPHIPQPPHTHWLVVAVCSDLPSRRISRETIPWLIMSATKFLSLH